MNARFIAYRDRVASQWRRLLLQEDLNFLLTNRIPRRYATLLMGRFSRVRSRALTKASLAVWRLFVDDLQLEEAIDADFESLNEVFIRALKPGARAIYADEDVIVSPCDGVVGAMGRVRDGQLIQAKGFPYRLDELLGDPELVERYRDGRFITIRLKSNMYHRFHAPYACDIKRVVYISGDTWNVNPIALRRVEKLFCKNERAVIDLDLKGTSAALTLVPVAAILVASIKLHCLDEVLDLRYRGANVLPCDAHYDKGEELGYFQAGSTIIVFSTASLSVCKNVQFGTNIKMGQPLFEGVKETQ